MTPTRQYSPFTVVRRFVTRTVYHVLHARLTLLALVVLAGIGAYAMLGGTSPVTLPSSASTSTTASVASADAADQYMRGMRDRDSDAVFKSLSPDMQQALEKRTGKRGSAAVGALFAEQDRVGERTVGYKLIASYQTVQGNMVHFYVVQDQRGDQQREIPYTLTLADDGTVANVE